MTFGDFLNFFIIFAFFGCLSLLHRGAIGGDVALDYEGHGFKSDPGCLSAWSIHVLPVHTWILTR